MKVEKHDPIVLIPRQRACGDWRERGIGVVQILILEFRCLRGRQDVLDAKFHDGSIQKQLASHALILPVPMRKRMSTKVMWCPCRDTKNRPLGTMDREILMLIHQPLHAGAIYPQLSQFPTDYADFLAAFRDGQTIDNNLDSRQTMNTVQYMMFTTAITSKHLEKRGNPIQGHFLVDIFLTQKGQDHIREPQDRPFCEMAIELAKKSTMENDGKPHPYVGAVIVKGGKVVSTGYRGETGEGRHAEYCALRKLNDAVDNVDLSDCTVYTTLEPCSERNPPKRSCASRLIKAKAARVVSGMPDKDKNVYGLSSLAEAKIHIGLFPSDLMQELLALNKAWSDTRRGPEVMPPPNNTNAIANARYYKPGTPMTDSIFLVVKPPKDGDGDGFFTIEDTAKNVLACGRTIADIAVEWRAIYTQRVIKEKMKWNGGGSSNPLLNLP